MELIEHFCDFATYCKKCVHKDEKGYECSCEECLDTPVNEHTTKPIKFEEKK